MQTLRELLESLHSKIEVTALDNQAANLLQQLIAQGEKMSEQMDKLLAEVAECKTATESAITLIGGLSEKLKAAQGSPEDLSAVIAELDANTAALAAAVASNTPGESATTQAADPVAEPASVAEVPTIEVPPAAPEAAVPDIAATDVPPSVV